MTTHKVLVTGGAGFIGSYVVDLLVQSGHDVIVVDCLDPQVHGPQKRRPAYLNREASYKIQDIRHKKQMSLLVGDVDAIIHLAAAVGVAQSMYEIEKYIDLNTRATSLLLDLLANSAHHIRKVIVASSMSIYGEGKYSCKHCGLFVTPDLRVKVQKLERSWEHACPNCGSVLAPVATDEDTLLRPTSIYAMSKRHQEEMAILVGKAYSIPTVALRFFNACGPRQSLANPYTGAVAIFMSRIVNNQAPYIFEDGNQLRDFIHVKDIARACKLALEHNDADYLPVNIGTGRPTSILEIAQTLIELCGASIKPHISNEFRKGDIRHCFADTSRAKKLLNFEARLTVESALVDLVHWTRIEGGKNAIDMFDKALSQLRERQLA